MVKTVYVPALGGAVVTAFKRKLNYNGKHCNIYTPGGFYNYKYGLMSAFYGSDNFRKDIDFPSDGILIGDSGGFQIASYEKKGTPINLSPDDVLQWLEKNCDIGMNLDFPTTLGTEILTKDRFEDCLKKSLVNFEHFKAKRTNPNLKLYNVLHGENLELLEIWYNKVKHLKFEGWAIGMKPASDPLIQALGFMFLYEKGELNNCYGIHFFGTSGYAVIPVICYLANILNNNQLVTFDSSSYAQFGSNCTYIAPVGLHQPLRFGKLFKEENPDIKELPCNCEVCKNIKIDDLLIGEESSTNSVALISLHNLSLYLDYVRLCNSIVGCKEKLLSLKTLNERSKKAIEFTDFCLKNGVKKAYEYFKEDFSMQSVSTQKKLF